MKSNLVLLGVLLCLSVVAVVLLQKNKNNDAVESSGYDLSDRQFALDNIDELYTISLNRPKYPKLVFTKAGDKWIINENTVVNRVTMNYFLAVLNRVELKYIPPKSATENIKTDIKENGIEIILYDKLGEVLKHYNVGTETGDGSDTPFLMHGASQPYMMYLKGLDGSVRRRMNFDLNEWRSKDITNEVPENIKQIKVTYPLELTSSFTIFKSNNEFQLLDYSGQNVSKQANQNTINAYLNGFTLIVGESNESNNNQKKKILSQPVFCEIQIERVDGSKKTMEFYSYIDISRGIETTSPNQIHPDNKFFIHIDKSEFIMGQYRVLNPILKGKWYFL